MLDPVTGRAKIDGFSMRKPRPDSPSDLQHAFGTFHGAFRSNMDSRLNRFGVGSAKAASQEGSRQLPAYLEDNYWWAYLHPTSLKLFDHTPVVSAILWGCYGRLKRAAFEEFKPGQKMLQAACVYGDFSLQLTKLLGAEGRLEIVDIAPFQVANCRRKLREYSHAQVRLADAAETGGEPHEAVCCFFLLHELPDHHKRNVIDALLNGVADGGKVVFIDYHRPNRLHPLKALMGIVFDCLEPFAKSLWHNEISSFATSAENFEWRKETYFGGLYQKVVAKPRKLSA